MVYAMVNDMINILFLCYTLTTTEYLPVRP